MDLIAREFKVHHICYKTFTHGLTSDFKRNENDEGKEYVYRKANFEEVKEYIKDTVLQMKRAAPITTLQDISGIDSSDRYYRQKLKKRIENEFGDKITFLSSGNLPEVIVSSDYFTKKTVQHDDTFTLQQAAKILQKDILDKFKNSPTPNWPPTADDLDNDTFNPPSSVMEFMKALLNFGNRCKEKSSNITRMAESFAQDIVFAVTRGEVLQLKHYLLALGLHSLTGSRKVIDIINKFGHCLNYNLVCEIETAQAEMAQKQSLNGVALPLQPQSPDNFVYTHFWVDNFDVLVDKQFGGGSVHTTHLVAFQEKANGTILSNDKISIPRRKSRYLPYIEDVNIGWLPIKRKQSPPTTFRPSTSTYDETEFNRLHFLWTHLRKNNSFNQTIPIFKGWKLKLRSTRNASIAVEKTTETYLPPLNAKVTEFSTIQRYMLYLQNLATEVRMPYVNITLDVGAAMNAYLVTWNAPEMFNKIIIHLGSFHFLKENFQVTIFLPLLHNLKFNDLI